MKNLTWQNPEQLFVAQELINKVKSKCCGIKGDNINGKNLYKYCFNNPVKLCDPEGDWPKWINAIGKGIKKTVKKIIRKVNSIITSIKNKVSNTVKKANGLPKTGQPGSSRILQNPNGTPKQKRWYGPDGTAERDRDYNHSGNVEFPHDHEWKNGIRGKEHLPPSPDYKISIKPVIGSALVIASLVGLAGMVINDITGIGTLDNFLIVPFSSGLKEGLIMIFGG